MTDSIKLPKVSCDNTRLKQREPKAMSGVDIDFVRVLTARNRDNYENTTEAGQKPCVEESMLERGE